MKFFVILAILIPGFASASIVINEIAWMGSSPKAGESATVASNNEWIELYNNESQAVDLSGWILVAADGQPSVAFSGTISTGGYFLLERSDDETVPGIAADFIYTGVLNNSGEKLELRDASGAIIDSVDAMAGWPAGDNTTKETMQLALSEVEGRIWITAVATPRSENANTGNTVEIDGNTEIDTPGVSVVEPKRFFTVDAGENMKTVAGAEARFQGAAFGFDGKLLDETSGNARYLWNFGDGTFFEAKNANHIYRYPGAYRAALYVSSGQTSGNDVVEVMVGESSVAISEAAGAWIELVNEGAQAVDLSSWQIRSDRSVGASSNVASYTIPAHTIMGPRAFVVFSQETTGLLFGPVNPKAELRYANGTLADTLAFAGTLLPEKSIMRDGDGNTMIGDQTPGRENKMYKNRGNPVGNGDLPAGKAEIASSPRKGGAPRNDEQRDNQALVSETMPSPSLPLYKGRNGGVTSSNYFWLAVSISIGLIAGAVVLALRTMVLF